MSLYQPTLNRPRIAAPIVESSRLVSRPSYRTKLYAYIKIPEFSVESTWRGASEIVKEFHFTLDVFATIIKIIKVNPNYCACIAWKPTAETIVRYKLWKDVGEILYVSDYEGQLPDKEFSIEIWNTPTTPTTGAGLDLFLLSILITPALCQSDENVEYTVGLECTDITFNLLGFNPYFGDYYILDGTCGGTLLVTGSVFEEDGFLIWATDDTWHRLYAFEAGGTTYTILDPVPTPDPLPTPYIPMKDRHTDDVYKLIATAIEYDGDTVYHLTVGDLVESEEVVGAAMLPLQSFDDRYWALLLEIDEVDGETVKTVSIEQTAIEV